MFSAKRLLIATGPLVSVLFIHTMRPLPSVHCIVSDAERLIFIHVLTGFKVLECLLVTSVTASDFEFALQWKFLTHDFHFK